MRCDKKKPNKVKEHKTNKEIRAKSIFLLSQSGAQLGTCPFFSALDQAQEAGLDLVQIGINGDTPVCKIMDYGRFCFEKSKNQQKAKKEQKSNIKKEIKINPAISTNDLDVKINKVIECLKSGYKVGVLCVFKGRQVDYPEIAFAMMATIIDKTQEIAKAEFTKKIEGRNLILNLVPIKK